MRLVFAGTPEFAERALARLLDAGHEVPLVLTQPDRPAGRGMHPVASPVKRTALARGLKVFQPENLKSGGTEEVVAARPDVMVVAAYGLILPQALLAVARHGALNIHASLLPRWRGAAPIQRAILAGDAQTGISIMQMDAGLDTGAVLAMRAIPIAEEDDSGSLHDKLAALGAEMIVESLEDIERGQSRGTPQPQEGATYAKKIGKAETAIDWRKPASELARLVRAFRPAPGATTRLEDELVKIWRVEVTEGKAAPGELLRARDALVVACGEAALAIHELQRPGGRRLTAAEFLRGRPLRPGTRLG